MNDKTFKLLSLILSCVALVLFVIGFIVDWPLWGTETAQSTTSLAISLGVALAVVILMTLLVRPAGSDDSARRLPITYGLVAAVLFAVGSFIFAGEGFFWRNLFADHIGIFGTFSEIAASYQTTPPGEGVVPFWQAPSGGAVITAIFSIVYALLLYGIACKLARGGSSARAIFFVLATVGLIALFALPGDFSIYLLLAAATAYTGLVFLDDSSKLWAVGLVLIASIIFHPSLALIGFALIAARFISGKGSSRAVPVVLLLAMLALGAVASIFGFAPFDSAVSPKSLSTSTLGGNHIFGFINQLFMVGHFIWLIALISLIARVARGKMSQTDIFLGGWFVSGLAYHFLSYSDYGWILGYPASAIVLLPAVIWLAHFAASSLEPEDARKSLIPIAAINSVAAMLLLFSIAAPDDSAETFAEYVANEPALSPKEDRGIMPLMAGAMLVDDTEKFEEAVRFLEPYTERMPAEPIGQYYYGWANVNIPRHLTDGVSALKVAERILEREKQLFWKFNYRMGQAYFRGANPSYGSTRLERAAAESLTVDILEMLAYAYDKMKVNDSIISKYEQLMAHGETSAVAFYRMGYAAVRDNDTALGLYYFNRGIHQYPQFMDSYEFPARVLYLKGEYDSLKALAEWGLKRNQRSPELEAVMILVYHYLDEPEKRDSAYSAYIDRYFLYPGILADWGTFLEENGMIYAGRKMQAADLTAQDGFLAGIIANYRNLKEVLDSPDKAKFYVDSMYNHKDLDEKDRAIIDELRAGDDELWPDR